MVYRRRQNRSRRYRRRLYRPRQSNFQRYAGYAVKALKGVNYIRGLVNSEVFKHDIVYNTIITNSGVLVPLTSLAEGNGDDDRTGNSIFVRSVNLDGSIAMSGSNNTVVRLALIKDSQQISDTTPAWTDVYESTSMNTHLNSNTVGRFTVLYSKKFTLISGFSNHKVISMNKAMRMHVRYNGATGTDVQRNGLYLALISNQASPNAPAPEFHIRVSYHDN